MLFSHYSVRVAFFLPSFPWSKSVRMCGTPRTFLTKILTARHGYINLILSQGHKKQVVAPVLSCRASALLLPPVPHCPGCLRHAQPLWTTSRGGAAACRCYMEEAEISGAGGRALGLNGPALQDKKKPPHWHQLKTPHSWKCYQKYGF